MTLHSIIIFSIALWTSVNASSDIGTNAETQMGSFCRRFEHRTTVLNNKLYIDGGFVNANPLEVDGINYTNHVSLYSDLLITENGMPNMTIAPLKNSTIPALAGGTLWADAVNDKFYAFGGYFPGSDPVPFQTWSFHDTHSTWMPVSTLGDNVSYVAHGMSAVAPEAGVGYYLGGFQDGSTSKGWNSNRLYTSSLVEFDMVGWTYTNSSGPNGIGRGEDLMVFIPASTSGLLIYFGGVTQDPSSGVVSAASMDEIWIYDISLQKWYNQTAVGTVPENRMRFCGDATWPDDMSSFNIYIYGGLTPNSENENGTIAFDDLYILSVPAFTWVKYYPAFPIQLFPHHSKTCNIINGTQMIVMGGTFPYSDQCDATNVCGQHNVDLGQLNQINASWTAFRNDNPSYLLPPVLYNIIGGSDRGGANITEPINSTRTYDQYLFQKAYKVPQRYPTPDASSTGNASPNLSPLTKVALIGIIVGSVGGGVLLGIGMFSIVYSIKKRHERNREHEMLYPRRRTQDKLIDKWVSPMELSANDQEFELDGANRSEIWTEPIELPVVDHDELRRKGWI